MPTSRAQSLAKKARGECHTCSNPALPGKSRCEAHLLADRQRGTSLHATTRRHRLIIEKRARGECRKCAQAALPNMAHCQSCLTRKNAAAKRRLMRRKKEIYAQERVRRQAKRARGECKGCPSPAIFGKTLCKACALKESLGAKTRYRANIEQSRAKTRSVGKKWRASNPEVYSAQKARQRARKRSAVVNDLSAAQWREIQEAQHHRCYYCGKRSKGKLTRDHIIPLREHGNHTVQNIVAACHYCNAKKRADAPPIPVQPFLLTVAPRDKRNRKRHQAVML